MHTILALRKNQRKTRKKRKQEAKNNKEIETCKKQNILDIIIISVM